MKIIETLEGETVDGRDIAADFLDLPSREVLPGYFMVIKYPISLNDIKRKLQGGQYANLALVKADLDRIWANAHKFNLPESQIYVDAKRLKQLLKIRWGVMDGSEALDAERLFREAKSASTAMRDWLRERLAILQNRADPETGRRYSQFFVEPPPESTPGYYDIVKKPMAFTTIQVKLAKNGYSTASNFMNDVHLMINNAKLYNQAGSPIWNDANELEIAFQDIMRNIPIEYTIPLKKQMAAAAPSPTPTPAPAAEHKVGFKFKIGGGSTPSIVALKPEDEDLLLDISNTPDGPIVETAPEPPTNRPPPPGSSSAALKAWLQENDQMPAPSDPPPAVLLSDRQQTLVRTTGHGEQPSFAEIIVQSGTSVPQVNRFSTSVLRQFCIVLKKGVELIYVFPSLRSDLALDDDTLSFNFTCLCRPSSIPASRLDIDADEAETMQARTRAKYALRPPAGNSSIDLLITPHGKTEVELYRLLVFRGSAV